MQTTKPVQISLPVDLLAKVDQVVAETGTNRSTLIREALEELVWQHWVRRGEQEEAAAFARQPQVEEEIAAGEEVEGPRGPN